MAETERRKENGRGRRDRYQGLGAQDLKRTKESITGIVKSRDQLRNGSRRGQDEQGGTMSMKDRQWRKWTMKDWNEALFEHFFLDPDGEDHPVHRIPVTGDELLKVVGGFRSGCRCGSGGLSIRPPDLLP